KELGYGHDYLYPHNYKDGMVKQEYLPEPLKGKRYYNPKEMGYEKKLKEFMERARAIKTPAG
ncbi:MAG: replication-associated recombination protein A, partial [Proteobacteria bacterium]|nr:replication-associated recombination protein A [Pseudomonadota bacterium]